MKETRRVAIVSGLSVRGMVCGLLVCVVGFWNGQGASGQDGRAADWPSFRGDAALTGVAASRLPKRPRLLWTFDAGGLDAGIESTAAIVRGTVYVGTLNGLLYALRLSDGRPKWKYSTGEAGIRAAPTVAGDRLLVGDEDGRFHAVDARTGKELWQYQTQGEIISSANVVGGRVLFGSYDNHLYCLELDSGKLLWRFETAGYVHSSPAVADGKTFVSGCDAQLRVLEIASGKEVSSVELGAQTGASPAVHGDHLYVGHYGNQVLAIDWKRARVLWQYEHPKRKFPFMSSPAVCDRYVVVGGRDRLVHCLDRVTGKAKWTFRTQGEVDSSPVIVGGRVYVGSRDGTLYGLSLETGRLEWQFASGGPISASPAVAAARLVIGNEDGKLFCFGAP